MQELRSDVAEAKLILTLFVNGSNECILNTHTASRQVLGAVGLA